MSRLCNVDYRDTFFYISNLCIFFFSSLCNLYTNVSIYWENIIFYIDTCEWHSNKSFWSQKLFYLSWKQILVHSDLYQFFMCSIHFLILYFLTFFFHRARTVLYFVVISQSCIVLIRKICIQYKCKYMRLRPTS